MSCGRKSDLNQYKKVDHIHAHLQEYFRKGYKVFNLYHFRTTDELVIQLKDGKGGSVSLSFKCTYPVYRLPIKQLKLEQSIFQSLYYVKRTRCDKIHVPSDTINEIGKLNTRNYQVLDHFPPDKFLVYNVLRPEYYVSTELTKDHGLSYEETRIGSLDIEIASDGAEFPEPSKAEHQIALLSIFDFKTLEAYVFYLNGHNIDVSLDRIHKKINENMPDIDFDYKVNLFDPFDDEKDLINNLITFMNNNYDIIVGWNVNAFDMAYITNRAYSLGIELDFGIVYDGFGKSYVFKHFVAIDYISIYKFFVKKNPSSLKLADIASENIGVSKIQTDTFLDIAYNITDNVLVFMIDKKLNLINQMFSFKDNGSLLHVFNVRNALEPLIIKLGAKQGGVFIANQYTIYYNIYFNEVYKFINREILKLEKKDLHIHNMKGDGNGGITYFLTHLKEFQELLEFYMITDTKDSKDDTDLKEDSAGAVLSKMVEKIFKKTKRKKKNADGEDVNDKVNISELTCKKNFDYETDQFDEILLKLYCINTDTIFGYPGAFNKSFRGVASDLVDLDLYSMYPVIIYALNISIETAKFLVPMKLCVFRIYDKALYEEYVTKSLNGKVIVYDVQKDKFIIKTLEELEVDVFNENGIIANTGMIFDKKVGFIPRLCEYFLEVRAKYKTMMKEESDPVIRGKYNIYQLLYKVYNNSIYGYMGYRYSVLFNRLLVSSVTIMGRSEILYANHRIIDYLGGDQMERIVIPEDTTQVKSIAA